MPETVTLLIEPVPADARDVDLASTLREVDAAAPALRVGELSTQRGDGVFETLAVIDGHAQETGPHLDRLRNSAVICELPEPNLAQWRAAIDRAVASLPDRGQWALKLVLSRGVEHGPAPTAWLHASRAADFSAVRERGVAVVTLDRGYAHDAAEHAPWLLLGAKTLSYATNMAALREARRRGADDTIFVSSDGYVMEGPTSSVILRHGDVFSTPAPSGAILHGTTQQSLFEHLAATGRATEYRDIPIAELGTADALWLVSSVRLAVGVTRLDGASVSYDAAETREFNDYLLSPRD
ncbi:aminodeoxychorismate lyase [Agromyces badenianii]|uniref:Aminodeoxychorismate lyase n=1 Tax=Agromyces badenianii TaxID=2080742 RepID=A0A2S0WXM5_9MICO|nr:aminodeoxychorismate lyase [Agromyces badenianii]AWB96095.1 aminodeoxychorismate lyase [Agromyces badenianii]PWC04957.1 aminodeoxychorismate lyase [Agromyces badenianii]